MWRTTKVMMFSFDYFRKRKSYGLKKEPDSGLHLHKMLGPTKGDADHCKILILRINS